MPGKKPSQQKKAGTDKNQFISDRLDLFEDLINQSSTVLSNEIFTKFLDQLNLVDGVITNSNDNLKKVSLVDKAFKVFQETQGIRILAAFATDMKDILDLGKEYYVTTIGNQANDNQIQEIIFRQLGIDGDGSPKAGGYLSKLTQDPALQADIKKLVFQQIARDQIGYNDLKKQIAGVIEGSTETPGRFHAHYKKFAFDTYSQVDRLNSKLHGDRLGLKYFMYNGGTVKDSREFCVRNHGKVFSTEQAEEWRKEVNAFKMVPGKRKPLIKVYTGPIIDKEKVDSYDPITDMGGILCRHSADFISNETAEYFLSKQKPTTGPAPVKDDVDLPALIDTIKKEDSYKNIFSQVERKIDAYIKTPGEEEPHSMTIVDMKKFGLTKEETSVVISYTDDGYMRLNKELFAGKASEPTKAFEKALNHILETKVERYEGTVNRFLAFIGDEKKAQMITEYENSIGKNILWDGFSSFSHKERPNIYGGLQFIIENSRKGHNLTNLTMYSGEKEVLYRSGSAFKILRVEKTPYRGEQKNVTIYLEEL